MRRVGNLYHKICSVKNLELADKRARRGKSKQRGVLIHDRNRSENIRKLHRNLLDKTFKPSPYHVFKIKDPKEREIYRLPYYPDRIVHRAVMNVLEPIFVRTFTKDTYSCIKGRGIHKALKNLRKALVDEKSTKYCLKIDIKKFYPSIKNSILKSLLRRKFKDEDLLWLLDTIIDTTQGVPIGNYLSQYFANFYLTYFDHWIKEELKVPHYFRYCDDIVILGSSKKELWDIFARIQEYLQAELDLEVKSNYQVFPVAARGIDFVGYKCYHTHTMLRDGIKRRFIRMIRRNKNEKSINAYNGWLSHCDSINLRNRYLYEHEREYQ
jgi:RNA-directed DNA polymerase